MKNAAVVLTVILLGCIGQTTTTPTTVTTSSTITTSTSSSTSSTTTSTSLAPLPECDSLNASFWRALCHDDHAYEVDDIRYCGTVYCLAKFNGYGVCENLMLDSTDWVTRKLKACEAWAAGTPFRCDHIMYSGACIRWYALLQNNLTLCMGAENNPGDDCLLEFAFWRGSPEVCMEYNTLLNRRECMNEVYRMMAYDNRNPIYCNGMIAGRTRNDCIQTAEAEITEGHPLYGVDAQLNRV